MHQQFPSLSPEVLMSAASAFPWGSFGQVQFDPYAQFLQMQPLPHGHNSPSSATGSHVQQHVQINPPPGFDFNHFGSMTPAAPTVPVSSHSCFNLLHAQLATQNTYLQVEVRRLQECVTVARQQEDDVSARFMDLQQKHSQVKLIESTDVLGDDDRKVFQMKQDELEIRIAELQKELATVVQQAANQQQTLLVEKEQAVTSLQLQLQNAKEHCADVEDSTARQIRELESQCLAKVQTLRNQMHQLQKDMQNEQNQGNTLRSTIQHLQERQVVLSTSLSESTTTAVRVSKDHIAEIKRVKAENNTVVEGVRKQLTSVTVSMNAERRNLQEQINKLNSDFRAARIKFQSTEQELAFYKNSEHPATVEAREAAKRLQNVVDGLTCTNTALKLELEDAQVTLKQALSSVILQNSSTSTAQCETMVDDNVDDSDSNDADELEKTKKKKAKRKAKKKKKKKAKTSECEDCAFVIPGATIAERDSTHSNAISESALLGAIRLTTMNTIKHRQEIEAAHRLSHGLLVQIHERLQKLTPVTNANEAPPNWPETRASTLQDCVNLFLQHYKQERLIVFSGDVVQRECFRNIAEIAWVIAQQCLCVSSSEDIVQYESDIKSHLQTLQQQHPRHPYNEWVDLLETAASITYEAPPVLSLQDMEPDFFNTQSPNDDAATSSESDIEVREQRDIFGSTQTVALATQ